MILSEKLLKLQLRDRSDDSMKIEDLRYKLDGAVAKGRRVQNAVESVQSLPDTVRATVNSFHQPVPKYTKCMSTNVTDIILGFLFEFLQQARKLIEK